jgi:hypothetical protein
MASSEISRVGRGGTETTEGGGCGERVGKGEMTLKSQFEDYGLDKSTHGFMFCENVCLCVPVCACTSE